MNNEIATVAFEIIGNVGFARSQFIEAIQEAREYNFDKAEELIADGTEKFNVGHNAHMGLITAEAQGKSVEFMMILMHAEDLLISAENFKIIAEEMIETYRKLQKLENK